MLPRWPMQSRITPRTGPDQPSPIELKAWAPVQQRGLQPAQLRKVRLQLRRTWRLQLYKRIAAPTKRQELQQDSRGNQGNMPSGDASSTGAQTAIQPADWLRADDTTLQPHDQGLQEEAQTAPQEPSPALRRRRLFAQEPTALYHGSPAVRQAFIPKVAACKFWRPRLAHKLLPKFLAVLDGPCTAFLLRHLVKLQPSPHVGLWRCIAAQPSTLHQHLQLYLHQPRPAGPGPWPAPALQSILTQQLHSHPPSVNPRPVQTMHKERREFDEMVLSVCIVSTPKLHTFSSGVLGAMSAALGDLFIGQRLPAAFWTAWEAATLPFLLRTVRRLQGSPMRANLVHVRVWMLHIGQMLAGAARCGHTPSRAWQEALWAVLWKASRRRGWHTASLCSIYESWALLSMKQSWVSQRHGDGDEAGDTSKVALGWCPDGQALLALHQRLQSRLETMPVQRAGARLMVAALTALAAHQALVGSRDEEASVKAIDAKSVREFVQWWLGAVATVSQRLTASQAATGLWAVMCLEEGQQVQGAPPSEVHVKRQNKRPAAVWASQVAELHLDSGPTTTPHVVHVMLLVLHGLLLPGRPQQATAHMCLRAVKHTLPAMSFQQLLDSLFVLHAWQLRLPPSTVATLGVYLHLHCSRMSRVQLTRLLAILAASETRLPPACMRLVEDALTQHLAQPT